MHVKPGPAMLSHQENEALWTPFTVHMTDNGPSHGSAISMLQHKPWLKAGAHVPEMCQTEQPAKLIPGTCRQA